MTPASTLAPGTTYLLSLAGAEAADGTPIAQAPIQIDPGQFAAGRKWFAGIARRYRSEETAP